MPVRYPVSQPQSHVFRNDRRFASTAAGLFSVLGCTNIALALCGCGCSGSCGVEKKTKNDSAKPANRYRPDKQARLPKYPSTLSRRDQRAGLQPRDVDVRSFTLNAAEQRAFKKGSENEM